MIPSSLHCVRGFAALAYNRYREKAKVVYQSREREERKPRGTNHEEGGKSHSNTKKGRSIDDLVVLFRAINTHYIAVKSNWGPRLGTPACLPLLFLS